MLKTPKSQKLKRDKVHKVMGEYKRGKLKSGSGASVKSRSQAIAIAMKESGQSARMKRLKGKLL